MRKPDPSPEPRTRPNLSEELADSLRDWIFLGELAPGERLNEVALAARLGVSRTPIREALTALVSEGALVSVPRRGFFVRELTVEEARDIYPIRALLDPEALRLAGVPSKERLAELSRQNVRLSEGGDARETIELDDRWHLELIAECPNRALLDLIVHFIRRTRRYEFAYLGDRSNVNTAIEEHEEILAALGKGDLEGAVEALRRNLSSGLGSILSWLESRAVEAVR